MIQEACVQELLDFLSCVKIIDAKGVYLCNLFNGEYKKAGVSCKIDANDDEAKSKISAIKGYHLNHSCVVSCSH
jgi:hypothetical protein